MKFLNENFFKTTNKKFLVILTCIFGLNRQNAAAFCSQIGIGKDCTVHFMLSKKRVLVNNLEQKMFETKKNLIQGNLRKYIKNNVADSRDIQCYKGIRHSWRLPVRGQRTRTNSSQTSRV